MTLEFDGRREEIALKPGEERRIELPLDPASGSVLVRIRSSAGFRPSEVDPNSRDTRLLGVFSPSARTVSTLRTRPENPEPIRTENRTENLSNPDEPL